MRVVGPEAGRLRVACADPSCGATFYRTGKIKELRGNVDDVLQVHREVQQARSANGLQPNPWITGSFYLAVLLLLIGVLLVGGRLVSAWVLPGVTIAGLFGLMIVGAYQLRHDDKLSERGFLRLMTTTITKLPTLLTRLPRSKEDPGPSIGDDNPRT
jgi:hypothetical protein